MVNGIRASGTEERRRDLSKLKVIITGATGMVGEGVLLECLEHAAIEQVLLVNRRPFSAKDPKRGL